MNFSPKGNYAMWSDTHAISKQFLGTKWIYTAWELPNKILGYFESYKDAKNYIEKITNK